MLILHFWIIYTVFFSILSIQIKVVHMCSTVHVTYTDFFCIYIFDFNICLSQHNSSKGKLKCYISGDSTYCPPNRFSLVKAWRGYTHYYFSPKYCALMKIDENGNLTAEIYFAVCQGIKMSMKKNVSLCEYIQVIIPVIWVSIHVVFFLLDSSWWR